MKKILYMSMLTFIVLNASQTVLSVENSTPRYNKSKKLSMVTNINSTVETKKLLEKIKNDIITRLDKQIKNNPKNLWALIQKGWTLNSEGKYDEAIICFNKALKLQENSAAYMGLGMAYIRKGDLEKANTLYMKALGQNESNDPYYIDNANLPPASVKLNDKEIE